MLWQGFQLSCLDILLGKNNFFIHWAQARSSLLTIVFIYLFICIFFFFRVFFIAFKTDFWVYPVLAVLHWGYRLLFIAGLIILASTMYFSGEQLHYFVWGKICIVFFFLLFGSGFLY